MTLDKLQAIARHKDGTYVALELSFKSRQELYDMVKRMGIPQEQLVKPESYHTTIIYSRTPVPDAETWAGRDCNVAGKPVGYDLFNTKSPEQQCLVLKVACPFAQLANSHFNSLGASSDFEGYNPHITLAYGYTGTKDLPIPDIPLVWDKIVVEPLDPLF